MLEDFNSERLMINNKGLSLQDERNGLYIFVSAVVKADNEMKTGHVIKMTRDFHTLNADEIATELAKEALSYLGVKPSRAENTQYYSDMIPLPLS